MSLIYSMLRIADPRNTLRWIVYGMISCFAIMWTALVIQKVFVCVYQKCSMGSDVAIGELMSESVKLTRGVLYH